MEDRREEYDPAKLLTWFSVMLVFFVFVYLALLVAYQVWQTNEVETGTWGQFCLVVGWALSKAADIYGNRFTTSMQSVSKDKTIAQQARTAAAAQDALLDPAVSVTVDPSRKAEKATLQAAPTYTVRTETTEAPKL